MKLLSMTYQDEQGNVWKFEPYDMEAPNGRRKRDKGWVAECDALKMGIRRRCKKEIRAAIKNFYAEQKKFVG